MNVKQLKYYQTMNIIKFFENLHKIIEGSNASILIINNKNDQPDVESFLKDAENLIGPNSLDILQGNGIINIDKKLTQSMLKNRGITIAYAKISDNKFKNAIVLFNPIDTEGQRLGYHESGHIVQRNGNGLKVIKHCYSVKKSSYERYLSEAHAEAFAYLCILKDAFDEKSFALRKDFLKKRAKYDEDRGNECTDAKYPSYKYYALQTILDKLLEETSYKWVKARRYKTLAIKAEEYVCKHAKSSEEFEAYLNVK